MKKILRVVFAATFLYSIGLVSNCYAETPIHLVYENPKGCDEVSGIVTFSASVQGDGAPVPLTMTYQLRTERKGTVIAELIGTIPPSYEATFDTTSLRDGMIFYTAVPSFASDNSATLAGIVPPFRGIMVNNQGYDETDLRLNLTKPLIIIGSPLQPYNGPFDGWDARELKNNLMFAYNLDQHLKIAGIPVGPCMIDQTATVLNPLNPLETDPDTSAILVDLMGATVETTPVLYEASECYVTPFLGLSEANGLSDFDENTALGYIQLLVKLNAEYLNATPRIIDLYSEIVNNLTCNFNQVGDWYNTFEYMEPVSVGEPIHRLKEKLQALVDAEGITSILIFGNYHRPTDWEESTDSWAAFQEAVDEINVGRTNKIRIGSITNNNHMLMNYEGFLRSQYLAIWELVKSAGIPADKKAGVIIAGHGSSASSKLYDVSAIHNPVLEQRLKDYVSARVGSIYSPTTPVQVCYSEYANTSDDKALGIGEQVQEWVTEKYDYIFVYPMEWPWAGTETWEGIRKSAVELVDPNNTDIYVRNGRGRSQIILDNATTSDNTTLIVGETIFEQRPYNEASYHFYRSSNTQLLEDRLIELTQGSLPTSVLGTTTIKGGTTVDLSLAFSDSLLAQQDHMTVQNSGIRGIVSITGGQITGTVKTDDMASFVFALLAENGFDIENVAVPSATVNLHEPPNVSGSINAPQVTAVIGGQTISLNVTITIVPTVITLSSFDATAAHKKVLLSWTTESEIDNAGFNMYRSESENGEYVKINDALMPAKSSATAGASYEFVDRDVKNRKTYWYKLEDIDLKGVSAFHGPVSATPRLMNVFR